MVYADILCIIPEKDFLCDTHNTTGVETKKAIQTINYSSLAYQLASS